MVELSMDGVSDAANKMLEAAQPALFGLGLIWGITEADATYHSSQNDGYASNIQWRVKDALGHLGIGGINLGTATDSQGVTRNYTSVAGPVKIKPLGFLNKGFWGAIGAYVYKEAKLPYHREIYKAVWPFSIGYAAGGVFDPLPRNAAELGAQANSKQDLPLSLPTGGGTADGAQNPVLTA